MKTSVQRARATTQTTGGKSVQIERNATQKSNPKSTPKLSLKSASNPKSSTPSKASSKPIAAPARSTSVSSPARLSAKKPAGAKPELNKTVTPAPQKSITPKVFAVSKISAAAKNSALSEPTIEKKKPTALHATKKRAPKDLATQYGEIEKAARAPIATAAPRKRRNAASRAKLQAVIAPDDGLMQRLARAGAISSAHVAGNADDETDQPMRARSTRRSRKWETLCGKCGVSAQYSSSAALCVKCGAILVRD